MIMKKNIFYWSLIIFCVIGIGTFLPLMAKGSDNKDMKYIYLTFDDGPMDGSQRINDAILKEKVYISVMLIGRTSLARPQYVDLYRKNPYIEIGNHSYSHANGHYIHYYSNPQGVLEDFLRNKNILKLPDNRGRLPGRNMWRVNGRSQNDIKSGIEAADLLAKEGFTLYGWDLEWRHNSRSGEPIGSAEDIFDQIQKRFANKATFTESNLVLLSHDEMFRHSYEESELKRLIELLRSKPDYAFEHIRNYPKK